MNPTGFLGLSNAVGVTILTILVCMALFHRLTRPWNVTGGNIVSFYLLVVLVNMAGAKLFSLYLRDWELMPKLIMEFRGGWRQSGGIVTTFIFAPLLIKLFLKPIPIRQGFDLFILTFCLFSIMIRIVCFLNGCCFGEICHDNEWYCLSFPQGSSTWSYQLNHREIRLSSTESLPVFPAHLLIMGLEILTLTALTWLYKYRRFDGQVAIGFLVLQGACKAFAESYKISNSPEIQNAAIATGAIGIIFMIATWRHWNPMVRKT